MTAPPTPKKQTSWKETLYEVAMTIGVACTEFLGLILMPFDLLYKYFKRKKS